MVSSRGVFVSGHDDSPAMSERANRRRAIAAQRELQPHEAPHDPELEVIELEAALTTVARKQSACAVPLFAAVGTSPTSRRTGPSSVSGQDRTLRARMDSNSVLHATSHASS